ncbi:alkaline phosphatase family protein [Haliea atlantica]
MSSPRTCLLLLEAMEPELVRAGIASGQLPCLAGLCASGRHGDIRLLPGIGANALWPSLYTGLPPQRHGRFYHQQVEDGGYTLGASHQTGSQAPAFWEALAEAGCRVMILDAPKAPPASGREACYIANWRGHFGYRKELQIEPRALEARLNEAGLSPAECACITQRFKASQELDCTALVEQLEAAVSASRDLILNRVTEEPWDLLVAGLSAGHCAGHQLWHLRDRRIPAFDPGDPLARVYRSLDDAVGAILDQLPRDTSLAVFIGPGMGPGHVHPEVMGQVLAHLEPPDSPGAGTLRRGLTWLWRRLPVAVRQQLLRAGHQLDQRLQHADFSQRRCFPVRSNDNIGGVRINLQGREQCGQVSPDDYPAYLGRLAEQLAALRNADSGEPLVNCVLKTRDLYPGGELGAMPDLLVEWNEQLPLRAVTGPGLSRLEVTYPPLWSGAHNQHAMLILRDGTAPGSGPLPSDSSVLDIAATISQACGAVSRVGEGHSLWPRSGTD